MVCYGELNAELREEILVFLIIDVFISLYLTWLFVIKSRALLALENANQNALREDEEEEEDDDEEQKDDDEKEPLVDYGVDNVDMPTTYFIDDINGGLRSKSVRTLMLRCIYFGMLAMMTTWIHLALRFIEYINISCVETLINCLCVVLSFDITNQGYFQVFCWCGVNIGHKHGYGRNIRSKKRRDSQQDQQQQNGNNSNNDANTGNNNNTHLRPIRNNNNNDLSSTDQSDINQ